MTPHNDAGKFLRAAVKTGLRLQRDEMAEPGEGARVRTLQRIKASLRKRTLNPKRSP